LVDKDGNSLFSSAQTLATKLSSLLGVSNATINPTYLDSENSSAAHKLLFTVGFDVPFAANFLTALATNDIDFNLKLGDLAGLSSSANVSITPTGHVGFTFGIDLAPGTEDPIQLVPPLIDSQLRAVNSSTGAAHTPTNGRLTLTTAFKVTVGGTLGGSADVKLTAADTAGNNNIDDLVTSLQNAINAGFETN